MRRLAVAVAWLCLFIASGPARATDPQNTLYMDVPVGRVVIELRPDLAPLTVAHIKELTRRGFYDGLTFFRVNGVFAFTGDPNGNGSGSSGQKVRAEFSQPFVRGTVGLARDPGPDGLARGSDPDGGDSQFFICFRPWPFLDGKYTIIGQVTSGMEYVDAIKKGDLRNRDGLVENPDRVLRMQIAADAPSTSDVVVSKPASRRSGSFEIPLKSSGGVFVVPVLINGAITLDFLVDSGAADVSIPADVAMTLVRSGTITAGDFLGKRTYVLADGSTVPSQTFRIKSLKVGNTVLENVTGSISPATGNLLLGQSFLRRFESWSIDNRRHVLVLAR